MQTSSITSGDLRTSKPSTWCRGSAAEVPDAWFGCRTRSCDVVAGHADRFSDVSHFDRRQRILQRSVQARRASEHLRSGPTLMCETGGAGELPGAESTCCTGPHDDVVGRADRFVGIFEPTHASTDAPHRQHIAADIRGAFAGGRTVD